VWCQLLSSAKLATVGSTDATYSGVSCTSTGKLHEPLYAPHRQGDALMVLAEVLCLAGRLREAAEAMQQALKLYDQKGNLVLAAKARSRLSELT
jgi:hypothetical protein